MDDGAVMAAHAELGTLEPGTLFRVAGGRPTEPVRLYELVEHGPTSSAVRQVVHAEQIEFTRADGTPVEFDAYRRDTDRWSAKTLVVAVLR